ncbi:MAG: hypothetical protein JO271_06975 [Verrucomicrobia bacterium]|nr:hypothetical protein [Verrucomicrobiota bacterium]
MNLWPWIALALLGAWHGLNPGMGWLFAVSLGLQNRSRTSVFQAMLAIALGHAASVLALLGLAFLVGRYVQPAVFTITAGLGLVCLGSWRLLRGRHPRWVGMRVGFRDLAWWSCLMATAHGAGLMLLPIFLLGNPGWCGATSGSGRDPGLMEGFCKSVPGICLHSASQFIVAGLVAWLVYDILGVAILRRSWFNADLVWSFSLILGGLVILSFH